MPRLIPRRLFIGCEVQRAFDHPDLHVEEIAEWRMDAFRFLGGCAFLHLVADGTRDALASPWVPDQDVYIFFKSALREMAGETIHHEVESGEQEGMVDRYVGPRELIVKRYRDLKTIINVPEFLGRRWIISLSGMSIFPIWWSFTHSVAGWLGRRLIRGVMVGWWRYCCLWYIRRLITRNRTVISWQIRRVRIGIGRWSIGGGCWKNMRRSDLFLKASKKKDGVLVEQIYYSIAAGLSMIFATVVAFSFQKKYGNFTMPLFVALVVSHMLKDRIKELMRFYFAHRLGKNYFDRKTTISMNEREWSDGSRTGWILSRKEKSRRRLSSEGPGRICWKRIIGMAGRKLFFTGNGCNLIRRRLTNIASMILPGWTRFCVLTWGSFVQENGRARLRVIRAEGEGGLRSDHGRQDILP